MTHPSTPSGTLSHTQRQSTDSDVHTWKVRGQWLPHGTASLPHSIQGQPPPPASLMQGLDKASSPLCPKPLPPQMGKPKPKGSSPLPSGTQQAMAGGTCPLTTGLQCCPQPGAVLGWTGERPVTQCAEETWAGSLHPPAAQLLLCTQGKRLPLAHKRGSMTPPRSFSSRVLDWRSPISGGPPHLWPFLGGQGSRSPAPDTSLRPRIPACFAAEKGRLGAIVVSRGGASCIFWGLSGLPLLSFQLDSGLQRALIMDTQAVLGGRRSSAPTPLRPQLCFSSAATCIHPPLLECPPPVPPTHCPFFQEPRVLLLEKAGDQGGRGTRAS